MLIRTIPKMFIAATISGIITLISNLIISLIFGASIAYTVFIFLISIISFSVCLVYLLHIYHANGEGDVWEDYPEAYMSIFKDIKAIAKKEQSTLILILSLSAIVFLLQLIVYRLLNLEILKIILSVFKPIASISYGVPSNLVWQVFEYSAGALLNCVSYIITFAAFRWKWRRFM